MRGFVSPPISQALAFDALQGKVAALHVPDTIAGTAGVAKIELLQIHLKMFLRDVEEGAEHATLEDAEIVLDFVGGEAVLADVLASGVLDLLVAGELGANLGVEAALVGDERGLAVGVGDDDLADVLGGRGLDGEGAGRAGRGIDQSDNLLQVAVALLVALGALGPGDVGLICLHLPALVAAHRGRGIVAHGLADAVGHEPRGLVGHAEHAVQLVRRHAGLGGRHQVAGEHPLVERDLGALEDGADRDGELLAALSALVQALAVGLALKGAYLGRVGVAAMGADRAVRPAERLQVLAGLVGVGEDRIEQVGGHRCVSLIHTVLDRACFVKYITAKNSRPVGIS